MTERARLAKLTMTQVALHEQYVVDHASDHDDGCPEDDTCDCSMKPRNDAVNAVCHYLATITPETGASPKRHWGLTAPEVVGELRRMLIDSEISHAYSGVFFAAIGFLEESAPLPAPAVEPPAPEER